MRSLAIFCLFFVWVPLSRAQKQEPNLVDRLLRPNMQLHNDAQEKKFASKSAVVEGRGSVGTFYLQPNRTEKSFTDTQSYGTSDYAVHSSNTRARTVVTAQDQSARTSALLGTTGVHGIHTAYDANHAITSREYADQHPFLDQGKSQKSLDRKNPTLTIDQVRELLNKNK